MAYKKKTTWNCKDGSTIKIKDMADDHLQHSINLIIRTPGWRQGWLKSLEAERDRRLGAKEDPPDEEITSRFEIMDFS